MIEFILEMLQAVIASYPKRAASSASPEGIFLSLFVVSVLEKNYQEIKMLS